MRRQQQHPQPLSKHRRSGSISAWSVFAMIACLCCVAMVVNRGVLSNLRSETDQSARASALAAARNLLNDDFLRTNIQAFETESAQLRAKQAAVDISRLYNVRRNTPLLNEDQIRFSSAVVDPNTGRTQFLQNTTRPDRVHVTVANNPGDASGRLFLSGITGVKHGQLLSQATAILQNRLLGFRSLKESSIPLIPLALPEDETGKQSDCWTHEIELQRGMDQWAWNSTEMRAEEIADRLPEITISLHAEEHDLRPKQGTVVSFRKEDNSVTSAIKMFSSGLTTATFPHTRKPLLSFPTTVATVKLTAADIDSIAQALNLILGKPRIFPLAPVTRGTKDASSIHPELTRVIAARILRLRQYEQSLDITLQPCVLSTPTAVTTSDTTKTPQNRYIWKISAK